MSRMAICIVALGMVLAAVAPLQAKHKHKHAAARQPRQAHVATFEERWLFASIKRDDPPGHTKICTYMGGPKSSLWSCR